MTDTQNPTRQTVAKMLMESALVDDKTDVVYTSDFHTCHALRVECYKLRSAARLLSDFRFDQLRFEITANSSGQADLRIGASDARVS